MKLKTFNEFITEKTHQVNRKVQFIKVDPVKSNTDNKVMKKLTEDARDRFYEVFLQEDYKDILSLTDKMDLNRPMLVYAGSKNKDTEKFVMEIYEKNPAMVYNIPKEMKKTGSKVEFHKIFDSEDFVPKTVFKLDETEGLAWPIIAKPSEGHSGRGIEKFKTIDELKTSKNKFDLYSECIDFDREFRALCLKDKALVIYERQLIEEDNKSIETKKPDEDVSFVYIDQDMKKLPFMEDLNHIISKFLKKVPLDVYSLDFFTKRKGGKLMLIEANSCSGLGSNSLVHVYEALYEDFYNEKPTAADAKFIEKIKETYCKTAADDYPKEHKRSLSPK
jgi:glutathione synthase/RimK-type ligase-like ATP-grasp enzyme